MGYFSYDTVRYVEKKKLPFPSAPQDDRNLPDINLGLYDDIIVFDQVEKVLFTIKINLTLCFIVQRRYFSPLKYFNSYVE